ncbi:CheY-like chemotaxis protein [Deinococcus metalli]|uniref:CheY-like chemotaxis protein n=1 Tax=Deinococcus metalli TaxID=1141878 RepID=A0A7W8KGY3_9DEIO|nr:response regulator [Deinococcus metalli]MBB5376943.1 CheY-like chemotaxis protein [Deinococcus metalli]GHF46476.1 response regulator [Deinococcus metalli]
MTTWIPANATLFGQIEAQHVLVVEDSPAMRLLVRHILKEAGHHPVVVGSVPEALAELNVGAVDVIVSDLYLPGESGLDLLRRLRAQPGAPPMVMLTSAGEDRLREEAVALGARAFLTKPFSRHELLDAVFLASRPH